MAIEMNERHEETADDVAGHLWLNPWAPSYHHLLRHHLLQGGTIFTPTPVLPVGRLPEPGGPIFRTN